jgi:DNA gyrase subunit A
MSQGKEDQLDLFTDAQVEGETYDMGLKPAVRQKRAPASPEAEKSARRPPAEAASDGGGKSPPRSGSGGSAGGGGLELDASLMQEARRRYLNYALSVITARALPDVRDGLKPVQRRILFAMFNDEHLYPDAKYRKSAKVVGAVIGKYHPHGDTAVYDAMVRMAQDFSLRMPLVDGSGNFGSLDGDGAAAYRYTECRLARPAMELLSELRQDVVAMRSNYDGTAEEPVVLPARFPNLLVNGSTGIAVGMATNIPPHNLGEVVKACIALIDDRELTTTKIMTFIQGPDFPTGGQILNSKVELRQIYEAGQGAVRVRAEYKIESKKKGGEDVVITSIPYGINKSTVVERIAEVIIKRQLAQLTDVRDESTDDVRIVLEIKKDADPAMVMAYLFKHTPLQLNFNVNFTCLIPGKTDVCQPERLGVKAMLEHFIDFRFDVTKKRFEYELAALRKRIHLLEGFAIIFDALDETIRIIRKSDGKQDAAEKLMARFELDEEQVEAILELKLYKLARLEINLIRDELKEKKAEARRIEAILGSKAKLWGVVKSELAQVADELGTPRRTRTAAGAEEVEFNAEAYIVDEDAHVVVSRDGWIKRVRELKDPKSTRLRDGDEVMAVLAGSTKENVVFFTNQGSAYVTRINDIPPSTGYGDPAQKLFKFKDQERIIAAYSMDPRVMLPPVMIAVSGRGFGLRFDVEPHRQASTRSGRRYARPAGGDEMVAVLPVSGDGDAIALATRSGHVLTTKVGEVNKLENPGKGVTVIKTGADDRVIGVKVGRSKNDVLRLENDGGTRKFDVAADPRQAGPRGGKGRQLVKRSTLVAIPEPIVITPLANAEGSTEVH